MDGSGEGRLQTYCEGDLVTYLFKRSVRVTFVGGRVGWIDYRHIVNVTLSRTPLSAVLELPL